MGVRPHGEIRASSDGATAMIDDPILAQVIALHFGASAMTIGAMVFAVLLLLLVYVTTRDNILNYREDSSDRPRFPNPL
jgi:hypothetical protein